MSQSISFGIQNIKCGGCKRKIERLLGGTTGVEQADVSVPTKQAAISYDPALTSPEALERVIEAAGYQIARAG